MSSAPANAPALPLTAGAMIGEKYRVERELGRGGMGVVFKATHLRLGKPVAIKMLLPEALSMAGAVERFDREARAAAQVKSAHVAEVIDIDQHGGLPYMVMEFLEGNDLAAELASRGALPVAEVVDYLLQVCAAMHDAHRRGIVHRDLKPSNLFLAREGGRRVLKILDFGISKINSPREAHLTATSEGFGTVFYMSPEQVRSTKQTDARGDVWSLGVIAYELLTARLPFSGESAHAIVASIIADKPVPLGSLRPDLPAGLIEAIHRTLVKDRDHRTRSMADFAAALLPFGSGQEGLPPKVESPSLAPITDPELQDAVTRRRRGGLPRGLLVAGGVALVAVGAFVGLRGRGGEASGAGEPVAASASAAPPAASLAASAAVPAVEVASAPPEVSAAPKSTTTRTKAGKGSPAAAAPALAPATTKRTVRLD